MSVVAERIESAVTPELMLGRAEALVPMLLERAARTDAERHILPETVRDLSEAGLFRVQQPVEFGGYGMSPLERMRISRTLARGCASTGWVHAVLSSHPGLISLFGPKASAEVWGQDDRALASSAYAPTGRIVASGDGYRLEGRFPFSSGCELAQWAIVGARAPEEDGAAKMVLVPMNELTILDDWKTLGLRGTGSRTLQAEGVLVPAHRVIAALKVDTTIGPFSLCAVAVGIAEGAIERFVEHTVGRVSPVTGLKASDSEVVQALVAESSAEVDAAWLLIEHHVGRYKSLTTTGEEPSDMDKARMRRDQSYVGRLVMQAAERLYKAAGGSGAYDKAPLQRVFRDASTATLHPSMSWELAAPQVGRVLLQGEFVSLF